METSNANNGINAEVSNELGYQLDDPVGFDDPDTFTAWVEDETLIFADEANDQYYVWVEAHHPELDARVISTPHDLSQFCADWRRVLILAEYQRKLAAAIAEQRRILDNPYTLGPALDALLAEAEAAAKAVTK